MKLKVLGTGSKGNCYILTNDNGNQIIIELGLKFKNIFTKINLSQVQGVLVSHTHTDHLYGNNYEKFSELGFEIIMPSDKYKVNTQYQLGDFLIIPLLATHNVVCYSYLIRTCGKTFMFTTDTNKVPQVSIKLDYLIGEVNFIERRTIELTMYDEDNEYSHLQISFKNHHSLESMVDYLLNLDYVIKKLLVIHWSTTKSFDKLEVLQELEPLVENIEIAEKEKEYEF